MPAPAFLTFDLLFKKSLVILPLTLDGSKAYQLDKRTCSTSVASEAPEMKSKLGIRDPCRI